MIQGAISCDQLTFFDSSSCSRKLPAVWKNFFGTIGARSVAVRERRALARSSAPPRSKYSRIVGTSRRTISSPSTPPDLAVVVGNELHRVCNHLRTSPAFASGGKTG